MQLYIHAFIYMHAFALMSIACFYPASRDTHTSATFEQEPPKKEPAWRLALFNFTESSQFQLISAGLVLVSLFLPDSKILANSPDSTNGAYNSVLTFIFAAFSCELVLACLCTDGYPNGFFFWMDVLGTLSMLLDLNWALKSYVSKSYTSSARVLRVARAAKLGARSTRLMRVVKYTKRFCTKNIKPLQKSMGTVHSISNKLAAVLARQVAELVLVVVIVVPQCSYSTTDYSVQAWLDTFSQNCALNVSTAAMESYVGLFTDFYSSRIFYPLSLEITGYNSYTFSSPNEPVRDENKWAYTSTCASVVIDSTKLAQWDALFSIVLFVIAILLLTVFASLLNVSVDWLVVVPLERMMNTLKNSAAIMLSSVKALEGQKDENISKVVGEMDSTLETELLEKMIEKCE
jgi:hypothetical protein